MSKKFIGVSAIALMLTMGQASFAAGSNEESKTQHKVYYFHDRVIDGLNLTEEQKAQIKAYNHKAIDSLKARAQLKSLRNQINALVETDKMNESKLDSLIKEMNKIKGTMLKSRLMMEHHMYSLLTDKQKARLHELKKKNQRKHQPLK